MRLPASARATSSEGTPSEASETSAERTSAEASGTSASHAAEDVPDYQSSCEVRVVSVSAAPTVSTSSLAASACKCGYYKEDYDE